MKSRGFALLSLLIGIAVVTVGGVAIDSVKKQTEDLEAKTIAIQQQIDDLQTFGAFNPAAGGTYRLKSSIGTTDTSITLSSFKEPISDLPITMTSLNSDIGYGTLDPQSTSRKEFVSFTGITQNGDGTATLTGVSRGLSFLSPFTASTTLRKAHPGQSVFILSDSPQLFEEYAPRRDVALITGDWYISGAWGFTTAPTTTVECASNDEYCSKQYIDNSVNQGAATSTATNGGIVRLATLSEQADSYDGTPDDPAVLHAANSTSTCQVVGSYNVVASSTTGKIDKGCIDQTANYTLTGNNTFSGDGTATTTFNGGVDIDADSNSPLILNGVSYVAPSSIGSNGQVLTTNGANPQVLSWASTTPVRYVWIDNSSNLQPSSGNFATTTPSLFIPGGTLTASSTIKFRYSLGACVSSSSGTGTVYLRDSAGNTLVSVAAVSDTSSVTGESAIGDILIGSNNSSTFASQIYTGSNLTGTQQTPTDLSFSGIEGTASINFASDVTLKVVVQNSTCDSTSPLLGTFSVVAER